MRQQMRAIDRLNSTLRRPPIHPESLQLRVTGLLACLSLVYFPFLTVYIPMVTIRTTYSDIRTYALCPRDVLCVFRMFTFPGLPAVLCEVRTPFQ